MLLMIVTGLHADLELSVADTIHVDGVVFDNTLRVSDTQYISIAQHSISLCHVDLNGVNLLDRDVCISPIQTNYTGSQISGDQLFVLTDYSGVLVYDIYPSSLNFLGEISLHEIPGRHYQNTFLKLFGNRMVVGSIYAHDQLEDTRFCHYDVYEISDVASPQLLGSNDVAGEYLHLVDMHQTPGGYYTVFSNGAVYYSLQPEDYNGVNVLSNFTVGDHVDTSLYRDNDLYLFARGSAGGSILKCVSQGENLLSIECVTPTPLLMFFRCWQETDRVFVAGYVDGFPLRRAYFCYTPSEGPWTMLFQSYILCTDIYHLGGNYIGFSLYDVQVLDANLIQLQVFHQIEPRYLTNVLMGRYAILGGFNGVPYKAYDIQNRTWMNGSFPSRNCTKADRSVNNNQVWFQNPDTNEYHLVSFDDQGSYTLNIFGLPPDHILSDIWGDRALVSIDTAVGQILKLYQISTNGLIEIATAQLEAYRGSDVFYDADHIATCGLGDNGSYDYVLHRIEPGGVIQEIQRIPNPLEVYKFHVGHGILFQPVHGTPVLDISAPDNPFQCSSVDLPVPGLSNISYDGQDRYLVSGGDHNYIMDDSFSLLTSFKGDDARYVGRNTILFGDMNFLVLAQHSEYLDNSDPSVPGAGEHFCTVYPNPFRDELRLGIKLREQEPVIAQIFNVRGQLVKDLWHGRSVAGNLELSWDTTDNYGRNAASGIYLVRIKMGAEQEVHRAVLIRN